ncbi:MAG: hypothetical protein WKF37_19955 [Bryobacteraceae bacterium]
MSSNRTFDLESGTETTTNLNGFGEHVFLGDTLAPTDRWTFELPMDDNPCTVSVSSSDIRQQDLSEVADAVLALEYEVRDV